MRDLLEEPGRYHLMQTLDFTSIDFQKLSIIGTLTSWVIPIHGKSITSRRCQLEVIAILILERIGERIEVQAASKGHGNNEIGRGHEGVSGWVSIVTSGEVSVVG